jgi:isocitrate lyase
MTFDDNVTAARNYMNGDRFSGITRLYSARQVAEQQGTIESGYPVARANAAAFYDLLRELFSERKSITTFGPYSPSQAVTMKRMGIEGIYLDPGRSGCRPGQLSALPGAR